MIQDFIEELRGAPEFQDYVCHYQYAPPEEGAYEVGDAGLPAALVAALQRLGITRLYRHQGEAWSAIREGRHVLVATPTASGKTLVYNVPVAASLLTDPGGHALYLFPLKALEQDQLKALRELDAALPSPALSAAIYDGDTPPPRRQALKARPPRVLITNPDMLHLGFLPHHDGWAGFFKRLKFVVIDEVHAYRGILGSHMAQVLRRLRRVCRHYGSSPQFLMSSATIAAAPEFISKLTGLEVAIVTESGAPQSGRHFLFLNPPAGAATVASQIVARAMRCNLATICFTQGRKLTELIHLWTQRLAPELRRYLSSYRAGFLPEERREIEGKLASGRMRAVISTSALEMGIDIGGLDVCVLVGYPGTMVTTRQRTGRVGRQGRECLIVLVAQPDALDQYFMKHPAEFFGRELEAAVVDPDNPVVLAAHLPCAAQELPLHPASEPFFPLKTADELLHRLSREGRLLQSAGGNTYFARERYPQKAVNIRGLGESFAIFQEGKKRPLGHIDGHRAFRECHPGAVYLHKAATYAVERLDLERRNVWVKPVDPHYFTRIQTDKDTDILEVLESRQAGGFRAHTGRLKVTERFLSYEKRRLPGQELLGQAPLELPPQVFETVGMWLEVPDPVKQAVYQEGLHFMGGIHALEHALISMFPLFALADRHDIGGIAHPAHPQVGKAAVFIYDGYPGGVGLAARAYEIVEDLLRRAADLIRDCPCEEGCPSCIHSPKCGAGNKPLDKGAASLIASLLLGEAEPLAEAAAEPAPPPLPSPAPDPGGVPWLLTRRVGFFDLETCCSAEEVGGWHRCEAMGVSLAVLLESGEAGFRVYREAELSRLCRRLQELDLVVGFNLKRFDYQVLQPYTTVTLSALPTLDILEEIFQILGMRISLNHLAEKTLGERKTGDGLLALELYRAGRWEELEAYCRHDVLLTRRLFEFGAARGHLLYQHRRGALVRLPVYWQEERFFGGKPG
ncbi:MAG: DEAD/DEAH box helicase [Deltaproteobacteria bacterium]|nr:DEAD/DEAH box helicase [Deltaproteobacteria bacterium]